MKILFHTNTLNYRGTAVAVFDYAWYNQEVLGNESVIAYNAAIPYQVDMGTENDSLEKFKRFFEVRGYTSQQQFHDETCKDIDAVYLLKAGHKEGPFPPASVKTLNHAVFQIKDPHGDRYAYISDWLSDTMSKGEIPFVPHIVKLPYIKGDARAQLGISPDIKVIGRIGGFETFDLDLAKNAVISLVEKDPKILFLFVNTRQFIQHPQVKYVAPIIGQQEKSVFINTCNAMIHGRKDGESFGLAICESLERDIPVFAFNGGRDRHHVKLLKDTGLLYTDTNDLVDKIMNLGDYPKHGYKKLVRQFNPYAVMEKFEKVFLE